MKNQEKKFIGLKDLILIVLLTCLVLVIALISAPLFSPLNLLLSSILSLIVPAVLGGTIYVLITTKCPKIGTYFLFTAIFGLFFLISGSIFTAVFFWITGLIAELTMIGGRDKKWRPFVPFLIHWFSYSYALTLQLFLMRDTVIKTYIGMGMDEATAIATVKNVESIYTVPSNMLIVGICAITASFTGYFIGTKILGRHFKAAGVV